ncbi:hypothetical protein G6F62_015687 [Rhizopus arrhizus]|nr:hypothetical protein G6F62_015687 [Rhizopus arrhizus]
MAAAPRAGRTTVDRPATGRDLGAAGAAAAGPQSGLLAGQPAALQLRLRHRRSAQPAAAAWQCHADPAAGQ